MTHAKEELVVETSSQKSLFVAVKNERKNMRKLYIGVGLAGVLSALPLQATVTINPGLWYPNNSGGEFQATPIAGNGSAAAYNLAAGTITAGGAFQTFCVEKSEVFNWNTAYNVVVNTEAIKGGVNNNGPAGAGGGDVLSVGTAWLYSQFAAGTLAGFDYANAGPGRTVTGTWLQQTLWALEDEVGQTGNIFDLAVIAAFGNWAAAQANYVVGLNDLGVRSMNLYDRNTGALVQDNLVVVPEPTTMIAGALLLLPFGLSTLRMLRRKA